jgi:hypothetical protein
MYAKCIEKSAAMQNCHSSQYIFDIKELTTGWLSIYCNNDDISDWLKECKLLGHFRSVCAEVWYCQTSNMITVCIEHIAKSKWLNTFAHLSMFIVDFF